jgi:pimeloyl-ACP methyl ester carboxylesterase
MLSDRFTVYAMDRRGHGESGGGAEHALELEFEDVVAVLEAIGEPAHLVGHSYGGHCILGAALLAPAAAMTLSVYEAPRLPGFSADLDLMGQIEGFAAEGAWDELATTFLRDVLQVPAELVAALRQSPIWEGFCADGQASMHDFRAMRSHRFDPAAFRALEAPLLLLTGAQSPRDLYVTDALLASVPRATEARLEDQAHGAMLTGPRQFVDALLAFIAA